jgi:outer membrane protein TolC
MVRTFRALACLAVAFLAARPSRADEPPKYVATPLSGGSDQPVTPVRRGYSLQRCLDMADVNYPKIAEARATKAYYAAQLDEARTSPYSSWTITSGVGPAPSVRGNPVYSPNTEVSLSSNLGLAWRATLDGFVPLWTFGKITNIVNAAQYQVKVGEHGVQKERNAVRLDVRKAYFGLQFARAASRLVSMAASALDGAIDKLQKQIDSGEGDELDLLRLKTFRAELEGRKSETAKGEAIALAALRFLTGAQGHFEIDSDDLKIAKHRLGPVSTYLTAARLHRPDVNMARAGVEARKAQVEYAKSKLYPDIGMGLSGSWARAPEVADQLNPYVRDDANYFRYGFALGLRWTIDFLPAAARIAQARAQLEQTRSIERFALGGAGLEVETAYAEVQDAQRREKAYGDAERYAKQWMIQVQQGMDIGTTEEKDLVDPARQYALQRLSHLNAINDLNVALSKLALVTGWDAIAPDGT